MPKFSEISLSRLETCHIQLVRLFMKVIEDYDCSILCGHRGEEAQNLAHQLGNSNKQFPDSKHNKMPSEAVDVAPYPIDWDDTHRFAFFAGYVKRIADEMGIDIIWGSDWDSDTSTTDQTLMDFGHFELVDDV